MHRKLLLKAIGILFSLLLPFAVAVAGTDDRLQRLDYNNPGLVVDLGVGLWPYPVPMDADGDGDYDLILSSHDKPSNGTYLFENTTGDTADSSFSVFSDGKNGSRAEPEYAAGVQLPFTMELEMFIATAMDWDRDGNIDLVVGQEDGRVALVEHTGNVEQKTGLPQFELPRYFRQKAGAVKFGALATPAGVDWDGDGDDDIVAGNTAGYVGFIENLAGPNRDPSWAEPRYLRANDEVIRIQAGPNGSNQGPGEAKWGYTTLSVADWDGDGLHDLIVNSVWGKVVWYKNTGTRTTPNLAAAEAIDVLPGGAARKPAWNCWDPVGNELVTQWRTTPVAIDWNKDGLMDLVMLDQDGYLSLFKRVWKQGQLQLLPPDRIFVDEHGELLKLSRGDAGASGRRKFHLVDWDGDGRIDWRRAGGVPDLLVGAEDGRSYFMKNSRRK